MAGSKFELNIMQNLDDIAQMVEKGVTDKDIADTYGVSRQSFSGYIKRGREAKERADNGEELDDEDKRYLELFDVYARARKKPDEIVEAALFLSCQDRTIDKTITIRRYDPEGNLMWIEEKTEQVPVAASVPAQQFYLANRKRKDWEYKPDTKATEGADGEGKAVILVEREKLEKK